MTGKTFYGTPEMRALAKRITFTPVPRDADDRRYSVTVAGVMIGRVYASTETIERRPKGARYVTSRWSRPCWRYEVERPHRETHHFLFAYASRIKAAADLVSFAIEPGGLLAGVAARLVKDIERDARKPTT